MTTEEMELDIRKYINSVLHSLKDMEEQRRIYDRVVEKISEKCLLLAKQGDKTCLQIVETVANTVREMYQREEEEHELSLRLNLKRVALGKRE
jgi:N-acetylglucosamine kinase-like BadF-type ATPase